MPRNRNPHPVNDYQLRRILDLEYSEAAEELCVIARARPTIWEYPMVQQWMRENAFTMLLAAAPTLNKRAIHKAAAHTLGVTTPMRRLLRPQRPTRQQHRPEPVTLVIGQVDKVPLTRDGYEVIRSPNMSSKPNAKGKIVDKIFHGKGPALWRVELRTQMGNGYSTEYVRCRTSKQAEQHIRSKFNIIGKAAI